MKKPTKVVITVGCGVVSAIVLVVVVSVVFLAPDISQWFQQLLREEGQRRSLADNWQAPADDASPETFFPPKVSDYTLSTHDTKADIPEIHFDIPGWHARYDSGQSQLDVFAYQVTDLEREALFGRIEKIADDDDDDDFDHDQDNRSVYLFLTGYRCCYKTSSDQFHLWWMKGWLLVFRTNDTKDCEDFVLEFLTTTSTQNKSATP
jgi:hypothetical protein